MQPAAKRRKSRSVLQQQLNDDEAFFPRREIPRTPPRATTPRRDAAPVTPLSPRGNLTTPAKINFPGDLENCPPGPSDQKKVQATCFTPSKSLARSPLKIMVKIQLLHFHWQIFDEILTPYPPQDNVPQPPQWEIPRTPTTKNPSPPPPLQSPLAHNESGTSQIVPPKTPGQPLLPHCPAESEAELRLPQGLVCTDTDLAYLQRLENLKKHDQLQVSGANLCQLDQVEDSSGLCESVCESVCVCVERERERERERESVCVCVCRRDWLSWTRHCEQQLNRRNSCNTLQKKSALTSRKW